jgi:hypothetical protein
MYTHNVLYRRLTVVVLVTLFLSVASLPTIAAPWAHPAANPNAGWQEVGAGSASGGGISNSDNAGRLSMAIAPDGTPYVAWHDQSGDDSEIYVRRWNGSSWEEVGAGSASGGGISDNSGDSVFPSIAVALEGTPYVVWYDRSSWVFEIYVRRWNGSSWEELGAGSASGGGISDVVGSRLHSSSMAIGRALSDIVFRYSNENSSVYIVFFSPGTPVAIAPDSTPYVAWQVCFSWYGFICDHSEIYVRRWNGSSWEEVGAGSASGGGISNTNSLSQSPSVAVAPEGTPYVAWYDQDWISFDDSEIYVRRWNGSSWEEVGAGSASGGGISDNSELSAYPSAAIAPEGTPYIAWLDRSDWYDGEIYVRRWEGGGPTPPPPTATPPPTNSAIYLPYVMADCCGPDNYEPNSPCDQAGGRLIPDQTYQSYISCYDTAFGKNGEGGKGYDYFFFRTDNDRVVTIVLDNTLAGKDYDLYLYRHPDCENWIEESAGTSVVEKISTSLRSGTYCVLVFSPFGQYSTSPYSLRMTSP